MQAEQLFDSVKRNLNGEPGRPMVLGVCNALAARTGQQPWVFRAATLVLALFFTTLTLVAYVVLALVMHETAERTQGIFRGLGIWARETLEKCIASCRHHGERPRHRHNGSSSI